MNPRLVNKLRGRQERKRRAMIENLKQELTEATDEAQREAERKAELRRMGASFLYGK